MKLYKLFPIFMEGDGDDATGGSQVTELLGEDPGQQATEREVEQGGVEQQEEKKVEVAPTFDPNVLAAAVAQGFKQAGIGQHQQQQAPQLTKEEAEKRLNLWQPTKEWQARYDNLETREAAMLEQRNGMLLSANTIMDLRMKEMQDQFQQQYAPLQQYVAQQEATARESRFNASYSTLAKPEFKPLVGAVITGLANQGQLSGKDEASAFKLIASTCEAVIQQGGNPTFKLSATPAAAGKPTNSNALRASSAGAGGGGGGKPGGDDTKGKAQVLKYL